MPEDACEIVLTESLGICRDGGNAGLARGGP